MNAKKMGIGLLIAIAAVCGSIYIYNDRHTIKLPDLEPATFGISEDEKEDYPMLYALDEMAKDSFVKFEPNENMFNTFTSVSGGVIRENLGTNLEERESNYLYAEDLLNEIASDYTIKFDEKYMHTGGYRLGYEMLGDELLLLTSMDGDTVQHRYHLTDNYLRMYAEPEIVYFDMKKEGSPDEAVPEFELYNDDLPLDEENAYLLADIFILSIEHNDPVYAITALSERLEKEITDLADGKESDYINYDYYIENGLLKLRDQIEEKYGEDWTESLDVVFNPDTRIVTIKIGDDLFREYGIRHNTLINEIELVPTSDFDELREKIAAIAAATSDEQPSEIVKIVEIDETNAESNVEDNNEN